MFISIILYIFTVSKLNDMKKFIISVCVITLVVFGFMPNVYLRGFVLFVGVTVILLYAITHIDKKPFTRFIDSL